MCTPWGPRHAGGAVGGPAPAVHARPLPTACQSILDAASRRQSRRCGYAAVRPGAPAGPQPLRLELAPAPDGEAGQRHRPVRGDAGEQDVRVALPLRRTYSRRNADPRSSPPSGGSRRVLGLADRHGEVPGERAEVQGRLREADRVEVDQAGGRAVEEDLRRAEVAVGDAERPRARGRGRRPRRGGGAASRRARGPAGRGPRRLPAPRRSRRRGCGAARPGSTTGAGRRRRGRTRRPPPRGEGRAPPARRPARPPDQRRQQRGSGHRLEQRQPEVGQVPLEPGHQERQGRPGPSGAAAGAPVTAGPTSRPGPSRVDLAVEDLLQAAAAGLEAPRQLVPQDAAVPPRSARPRRGSPGGASPGTELVSSGPSVSTSSAGSVAGTRPGSAGSSGNACRTRRSSPHQERRPGEGAQVVPAVQVPGQRVDARGSHASAASRRGEQPPRDEVLHRLARTPASQLQPVLQRRALPGFHERLAGRAGQQLPVVGEHALQARGHRGRASAPRPAPAEPGSEPRERSGSRSSRPGRRTADRGDPAGEREELLPGRRQRHRLGEDGVEPLGAATASVPSSSGSAGSSGARAGPPRPLPPAAAATGAPAAAAASPNCRAYSSA